MTKYLCRTILLIACSRAILFGQTAPENSAERDVPVISGAVGFLSDVQKGQQVFGPKFEPVLLLPLGSRFLVEAEYSTELPVERDNGVLGPAVYSHSFEYAQLDYSAASFLTIVAGYFATPFGIYKERIDPLWIRNFLDEPLLTPINDNSSNGVMLRGAIPINSWLQVNYETSVSANVSNSQFLSTHQTSNRLGFFFPNQRLEIGASYGRILGSQGYDIYGFDVSWRSKQLPIDIRGEGLWSRPLGSGYWVEAAYRFPATSQAFFRHSQAVVRGEQFSATPLTASINPDLPSEDTSRISLGWNYWIKDFLKLNVAYARQVDSTAQNIATFGVVYFFKMPVGGKQ